MTADMTADTTAEQDTPIGTFCLVLHSHLPWVAHHGAWPVGEEWLHQAWAESYAPVFDLLSRLADEGASSVLTLGMTPILAAQLDDPYCLREQHTWLGMRLARALGMSAGRDPAQREAGRRELATAQRGMELFETQWRSGGSPILRRLIDSGVIEVIGGPLTHTFTPLLDDRLALATLRAGRDDATLRWGHPTAGTWLPECAHAPGTEDILARSGTTHVVLDGPSLRSAGADTPDAWLLADSDVAVLGRDLDVTYRVWSPRRGYPGSRWYRDFHSFDHEWGFRRSRVTGREVPAGAKAPYDPLRAAEQVERDAADFVDVVVTRLRSIRRMRGDRPGIVVAAYDTELFGHWWHEGPAWLERILHLLPRAGVDVTTLAGALERHGTAGRVHPGPGSWGLRKDWRVWTGPGVADMVDRQAAAQKRVLDLLDHDLAGGAHRRRRATRSPIHDQLLRSLLLGLASDWPFMVTHDSAATYARERFARHLDDVDRLARACERGDATAASAIAMRAFDVDHPFGHLDARTFI